MWSDRRPGDESRPTRAAWPGRSADTTSHTRLFEADRELLSHLPHDRAAHVRRHVFAREMMLPRSRDVRAAPSLGDGVLGLLVLDGFLTRRTTVVGARALELLGTGDLFGPGRPELDSFDYDEGWAAITDVRLALVDRELLMTLAPYPAVIAELAARGFERSRSLRLQLALTRRRRISARLHILFWHLADRFGRREGGMIVVPLRVPNGVLAGMVSAHRQATVTALKELSAQGLIERRGDGFWLLHGAPPSDLEALDEAS